MRCSGRRGGWVVFIVSHNDPGADYFTRLHPERAKKRALHQLEAMGYRVSLDPTG